MSFPITSNALSPEFKGYRIRQQPSNEQEQQKTPQPLIKIFVKNQTNGIPKIRHDVICNGKHYPFIPLFSFTSEDDLGILDQISTILLRDQNQILCEILAKRITQVRITQFQDLKQRFKKIFALQLKVDPEQLFLLLISDDLTEDIEFNQIFDAISQTDFINILKRVYENCPNRIIPKILRRINKYFTSTKGRASNSIEKLKKILKIIKSADESIQTQQKQQSKFEEKVEQRNSSLSKTTLVKKAEKEKKKEEKLPPNKIEQQQKVVIKPTTQVPKQKIKIIQKVAQSQKIKTTQKVTKKEKIKKIQKPVSSEKQQEAIGENESDWHDVQASNDEDSDIQQSINKMAFQEDSSDDDLKYLGPKKKNKKKNNMIIPLEPNFDSKKGQRMKKQKKNKKQISSTNVSTNQITVSKSSQEETQEKSSEKVQDKIIEKKRNQRNGKRQNKNGQNQLSQQRGRRQFSKDKKIDPRILLGINGASDLTWRERMRPSKFPKQQHAQKSHFDKENKQTKTSKTVVRDEVTTQITSSQQTQSTKNLSLQKIFCIPDDLKQGKKFKFQKRNYNLFVNKLFWVNISQSQITIQKEAKGYIRKCPIEIIDSGNGIMAEGITLNIDGLSNLEDGGIAFGDPVFQEFTPDGQWFHITSLDVFAYV